MSILLKPKELKLTDRDGTERNFIISRFPAVIGREIVAKYPMSAMPKLGDYAVNEETMLKLISHCAVVLDNGTELRLTTRALVDNHAGDWETLAKLEIATLEYNVSFFGNGKGSTFLEAITRQAQQWIIETLTPLSAQFSPKAKPPSKNSAKSTTLKTP